MDKEQLRKQIRQAIENNYIKKAGLQEEILKSELDIQDIVKKIRAELGIPNDTILLQDNSIVHNMPRINEVQEDKKLSKVYTVLKKLNTSLKRYKIYRFISPVVEKIKGAIPTNIKYNKSIGIEDLLGGSDQEFVTQCYRVLLNREPDVGGLNASFMNLEKTCGDRIYVMGVIRYSKEGKINGTKIKKLSCKYQRRKILRVLYKVPVLGYILKWFIALGTLPKKFDCLYKGIYNNSKGLGQTGYRLEQVAQVHSEGIKNLYSKFDQDIQKITGDLNSKFEQGIQKATGDLNSKFEQDIQKATGDLNSKFEQDIQKATGDLDSKFEQQIEVTKVKIQEEIDVVAKKVFNQEEDHRFGDLYLEFENKFRGSRDEIKERMRVYLPILEEIDRKNNHENTSVLDIGCGRGEWLELLKQNRYKCKGIDSNENMVRTCLELHLDVVQDDAIEYIQGQESESVNLITGIHIVEHISTEQLMLLLIECKRILKPGGAIIFETPNPENLIVGACNFYFDPTHIKPIPPLQLQYLAEVVGYENVQIARQHPYNFIAPEEFEKMPTELQTVARLFNQEADYAVIGYKH